MGNKKKIKIGVYGLGHLGRVTSVCLCKLGFDVYRLGELETLFEPNLSDLEIKFKKQIKTNIISKENFDYFWITFDTPVKGEEKSNVKFILEKIKETMILVDETTPIIISSQIPLGTMKKIVKKYPKHIFCYSPENLRHGTAIDNFLNPDRIVIGCGLENRKKFKPLFEKITKNLVWITIEEAEMVKHAINSFLATCITWANEFGDICEKKGINYNNVLNCLKTESRIGNKLPLKAGKAYTGKTLARDVKYLIKMSGNKFFKTIRKLNNKRLRKI